MWRQVALPVIVVALSWLAVSGSTNFYLQWLDTSYQRVFDENVASMHAASFIQQETWRLHAEWNSQMDRIPDWSDRLRTYDSQVQADLATIEKGGTEEEKSVSSTIGQMKKQYRMLLEASRTGEARQRHARAWHGRRPEAAVGRARSRHHGRRLSRALRPAADAGAHSRGAQADRTARAVRDRLGHVLRRDRRADVCQV